MIIVYVFAVIGCITSLLATALFTARALHNPEDRENLENLEKAFAHAVRNDPDLQTAILKCLGREESRKKFQQALDQYMP